MLWEAFRNVCRFASCGLKQMRRFCVVLVGTLSITSCIKLTVPLIPYTYVGPGTKWSLALGSDNLFSLAHYPALTGELDLGITGVYKRPSFGFTSLGVATLDFLNEEGSDSIYGVEVPGSFMILRMTQSLVGLVPMLVYDGCPEEDFSGNWIALESSEVASASSATQPWNGTFTHEVATNTSTLATTYPLVSTTDLGPVSYVASACESGIATEGTDNNLFFSSKSSAILHLGSSNALTDSLVFAVPKKSITSATQLKGTYAAIIFNKGVAYGEPHRSYAVPFTVTGLGSTINGTGTEITDVEDGTVGDGVLSFTLTSFNSPADGFLSGTITAGANSGALVCTAHTNLDDSGKKTLLCIGQSPEDNTRQFGLLAVSK